MVDVKVYVDVATKRGRRIGFINDTIAPINEREKVHGFIDVEMTDTEKGKVLSISGYLKDYTGETWGQCLDEMKPYFKSSGAFIVLYTLWINFHDNNHHGCVHQEERKRHEVLLDPSKPPTRFGSDWQFQAIPEEAIITIERIIKEGVTWIEQNN